MSIIMGIFIWLTITSSSYISNADLEEDMKTTFNTAVIIIWLVVFVLSALLF